MIRTSALHRAESQLEGLDSSLDKVEQETVYFADRLHILKELQKKLAGDLGDLREVSAKSRMSRQQLRIQIEEDEERIKGCREELETLEAENALLSKEASDADDQLRSLHKMHQALRAAVPGSRHKLPVQATAPVIDDPAPAAAAAAECSDGASASAASNAGPSRRNSNETEDPTSTLTQPIRSPKTSMLFPGEARDSVERQIRTVASETVTLDRERAELEGQRAELQREHDSLLPLHRALQEGRSDEDSAVVAARAEGDRLVIERNRLRARVEAAIREKDAIQRRREAVEQDLALCRSERDKLRYTAMREISQVQQVYSHTNTVRQRAMLDQEIAQKELVCLASAHSTAIAATGGATLIQFGREGAGGLLDPKSPETRAALHKVGLPLKRGPAYAAQAKASAAPHPAQQPQPSLPPRTPRSELLGAGLQLVGRV
eukprot:TRINITY_DN31963_c0_g1_i1.p1 TRINITY_DN31963_c0_g1~~TRINITY_DN31963_c0_g1_i1.p1  ORF type:complete len:435 (-),score=113.21 TRINITY_DN31963_c0_g1_i1:96-1400(-)